MCIWLLQVKCLRVLQYFPVPDDPVVAKGLQNVLKRIITGEQQTSGNCHSSVQQRQKPAKLGTAHAELTSCQAQWLRPPMAACVSGSTKGLLSE